MKAAFIRETGAPGVIQYADLPDPVAQAGEVLVQVKAVSVNPIDTYIRSGAITMPLTMPYVIGCDVAGVVSAVGPGAQRFKVGDRVWGSNQGLFGRQGSFSQLAAIHEQWLYPIPASESFEEAAAGALVGITAHLGLFRCAQLKPGELVFVNGGTGGVGSTVIQLAKWAGARVITTAGTEEKLAASRKLGADLAVNYKAADADDAIRKFAADAGGINVWFETQREPTLDRTVSMMAPRGRILAMAGRPVRPEFPWGPFYVKDLSLIGFAMFNGTPDEQRAAATGLNAAYELGHWKPHVGTVMPLSKAADAHQLQQDNTLEKQGTLAGKIVLTT